jgi:RNA polymerase sigma-70 factor, ECF subfamily
MSFNKVVIDMLPKLRRYSYSLTGNINDGDDLLHSSLEKIIRNKNNFKNVKNLSAYFYKIIQNNWKDRFIKNEPIFLDIETVSDSLKDDNISADKFIENENNSTNLKQSIDNLSEKLKSTLLLSVVEEKSYKEISEILEIPIGTVMSRLAEAKKKIIQKNKELTL